VPPIFPCGVKETEISDCFTGAIGSLANWWQYIPQKSLQIRDDSNGAFPNGERRKV